MSETERTSCRGCGREVDNHSRMCPYCGANPGSGEPAGGPRPEIEQILPRKPELTASERISNAIRSRSGLVLAASMILGVAILIVASSWLNRQQASATADVPPVPLTEVTDLRTDDDEAAETLEMPELTFEYAGDPQAMETFILEQGEVAPPPDPAATATDRAAETGQRTTPPPARPRSTPTRAQPALPPSEQAPAPAPQVEPDDPAPPPSTDPS